MNLALSDEQEFLRDAGEHAAALLGDEHGVEHL